LDLIVRPQPRIVKKRNSTLPINDNAGRDIDATVSWMGTDMSKVARKTAARIVACVLAIWLIALSTQNADAQSLFVDTKTTQDLSIKLDSAALKLEVRIKNSDGDERQVLFDSLYPAGYQSAVELTAERRTGAGPTLAKDTDAVFSLAANLVEPGDYITSFDIRSANGDRSVRKINLKITREGAPIPATLMAAPGAVTVTWPWTWLGTTTTAILLRNDTTKPISIQKPTLVGLRNAEGAADVEGIKLDEAACRSLVLRPGTGCSLKVILDKTLSPGQYTLDIGVGGTVGGWSQQAMTISSGMSIAVAFVVAALGVWVGLVVDGWRSRGRPQVDALIKLTRLNENLAKLQVRSDLADSAELLTRDTARAIERIHDAPPDDAAIAILQARYDRLVQANLLIIAVKRLSSDAMPVFAPRISALINWLTDPELAAEKVGKLPELLRHITMEIRNWPAVQTTIDEIRAALRMLDALVEPADGDNRALSQLRALHGKIVTAAEAFAAPFATNLDSPNLDDTFDKRKQTFKSALGGMQADGDAVADTIKQVIASKIDADDEDGHHELKAIAGDDWSARCAAYLRFWRKRQSGMHAEAAEAPVGTAGAALSPDVQFNFINGFEGLSADDMRRRRKRIDFQWNAAVIGLFALGLAVATITPVWGSASDIVKLFLAGVGARLALGTVTNK
jgi:hypothetical protein